ncbi:PadR family transcriptional regulator [Actinotalea sp. M2MS4P-6]|uniref:PadR family transcriptional regulator n=1 Tax=Actinotalea sp. M2MS4P-6 TaxID=2983762 RepID=UPI0021E4FA4F|nr:PadR family transcriptional regulator [Actinotalea sp. M2MS4P-6]MCV2392683.1 PadR family transcriptional regulator [Actinotalea sp. M2MS4P-6]
MRHPNMDPRGRTFRPDFPTEDPADLRGPRGGHGNGRGHRGGRGYGPGFGEGDRAERGGRGGKGPRGGHGPDGEHGFGPDGPGFGRRGRRGWGGPRPRGDVRAAILLLLDEQPRHGYELIGEITERSGGVWTPSPGSIYPTLQALEDEGLLTLEKVEGRRTASLTEAGSAWVAEHREELGDPFDIGGPPAAAMTLHEELRALGDAARQVTRVGSSAQLSKAAAAVTAARKELYRLLAEDDSAEG